jgi:hypothetical protein
MARNQVALKEGSPLTQERGRPGAEPRVKENAALNKSIYFVTPYFSGAKAGATLHNYLLCKVRGHGPNKCSGNR